MIGYTSAEEDARTMIRVLPPELADQIAAGEVVERPASVVKELVENSLDAGARRIEVEIDRGGLDRIVIIDDGAGMAPDEAHLALKRHATSKLNVIEDLQRLTTMGFRGEALPSIAAVSRLAVTTRRREDLAGYLLMEGEGRVVGAPPGTQIEVRDLFVNVPARLKFVKGDATEAAHVVDVVLRAACTSACARMGAA
jgi:DNA mismatch repair protein MutL